MIAGLPQWRCHKVVGAFKIDDIKPGDPFDGKYYLFVAGDPLPLAGVLPSYFRTRWPDDRALLIRDYIGGYLVQYEDGYLSWSPAAAFEAGYTRIG